MDGKPKCPHCGGDLIEQHSYPYYVCEKCGRIVEYSCVVDKLKDKEEE